jgi:hypothetical protein
MTQNLGQEKELQAKKPRSQRRPQAQLQAEADAALRDIAFVLKMTQQVRAEIDAEQEAAEPVLA